MGRNGNVVTLCTGLKVGDIVSGDYSVNLGGKRVDGRTCQYAEIFRGHLNVTFLNHRNQSYIGKILAIKLEPCPSGFERNTQTGVCEEPPPPYCQQPDVLDEMQRFRDSCAAKGNGYTAEISCNDENNSLSTYCAPPPDACLPGTPNWPACSNDDDQQCDSSSDDWNDRLGKCCNTSNNFCDEAPPTPCTITSPDWPECDGEQPPNNDDSNNNDDGNDNGNGNGTPPSNGSGNGSSDGGSSTPPPVEDNQDINDSIQALNADMNQQLTSINNDMNRNHGESLTALEQLKDSNQQAIDKNTEDIAKAFEDTVNAHSTNVTDAINRQTGQFESGLADNLGQVSDGLANLEETNEKGFSDLLNSLKKLTEGDVLFQDGREPINVLSDEPFLALKDDIETLQGDLESQLEEIKDYFNFSNDLADGMFNSHDLQLTWGEYENKVFTTLRENAGIISPVILFLFGFAGLREIMRAF
ncbi:hypothetical protein C1141_12575 [Vibrio agarivorans]|uniref:Uncharacterized protein n=2 Tax=Vibrio sagamiensis TaxID=512650 RepID=A0A511QLZ5_9VIBR|nr:hypothetical protein C1141_12575 [Vibrio agarivorans]GEM77532.1 hypothetical protein VSA01S_36440 [Vibrio sagamiensis NBRC 104589]